jgi:homoserine/homoserine lactone efflux protein
VSIALWLGFLAAALVIALTPGPGAVLAMSTGMRLGYRPALAAIAGLQVALLVHLAIVALGLGALLAASDAAFTTLRLLGAAYLVWLGLQKWRATAVAPEPLTPAGRHNLFLQGLLVNLANPKAIVFIAALVPQFIDPARPLPGQYMTVAVTLCAIDVAVMSGYALAASRVGRWLADPRAWRWQNRVFGGLFIGAGALLAAAPRPA